MTDSDSEATGASVPAEREAAASDRPSTETPTTAVTAEPSPPSAAPDPADFERRHPDALRLELAVGAAVAGAFSLAALLLTTLLVVLVPAPTWVLLIGFAVPALLFFPFLVLPRWRHKRYLYRAGDHGLELRKGIWWQSHRFIPHTRLQHTDIAQGPLERRFGLASLIVHTAGTHEARTTVNGLAIERARQLRAELTGEPAAGNGAPDDGV